MKPGVSKKAVLLLSGGLDSVTAGAIAKERGFELYALSFDYGQKHAIELKAARRVAAHLGVREHQLVSFSLRGWGGSALTSDLEVPKDRSAANMGADIPVTYVPARNTIFLSFALGWAEVLGAFDIVIGANAVDYSGYPDCRDPFLRAFERLATLATRAGVEEKGTFRVLAPLLSLTKRQIIEEGLRLGVDYSLTHSCYDPAPDGVACGRCDSCVIRRSAFTELGLADPGR